MSHQTGWIELYSILENGDKPDQHLVEQCKASRTGLGETMLHWYAIEGTPDVLQKLIDLGFKVNVQNNFGNTPIMECSQINRWDNARVLFHNGANLTITNDEGQDFFSYLREYGVSIPDWIT
jgi:ankyrin repeat protein